MGADVRRRMLRTTIALALLLLLLSHAAALSVVPPTFRATCQLLSSRVLPPTQTPRPGPKISPFVSTRASRSQVKVKASIKKNDVTNEKKEEDDVLLFGLPRTTVTQPLSLLLFSQLVLFIGVGAVIPTIPLYGREIGLSSAANGIVISAPALMLLLLARSAGGFADLARKPAMMGGMALIALSDFGTAISTSLPPLVVARLGLGAGRCVSESGERGMLADLAGRAPELRGKVLAAQQAVVAMGIALGAPAGGFVVERYGPRASFLCVTAGAVAALVLYAFLPETVTDDQEQRGKEEIGDEPKPSAGEWSDLLQDPRWRGLALCEIGAKFGIAAKIASVPILAADVLPGGAVGAGALLSAAGLTGLAGAPLGGWLTDRAGAHSTAILGGVVAGIGLLLVPVALRSASPTLEGEMSLSVNGVAFSAAILTWSTAVAAQGPALTAIAQELAPSGAEATAMALPRAAGDAVYLFAPFLLGVVADWKMAPLGCECAVAGICSLLGVGALSILRERTIQ